MPVGTYGTVKGMTRKKWKPLARRLSSAIPSPVVASGSEIMKLHGDLHDFMRWKGPILTDSGGFRFSLGDIRKITEKGVRRNPINGDPIFLDPEKSAGNSVRSRLRYRHDFR
jgi:queuine tRNA-ribosyltransferase